MKSNLDESIHIARMNLSYWQGRRYPFWQFRKNREVNEKIAKLQAALSRLLTIKANESVYVRKAG